jgi:hypothetical protein
VNHLFLGACGSCSLNRCFSSLSSKFIYNMWNNQLNTLAILALERER